MRRPKLLVAAARAALSRALREPAARPSRKAHKTPAARLLAVARHEFAPYAHISRLPAALLEAEMDRRRIEGSAHYSPAAHVMALAAVMAGA